MPGVLQLDLDAAQKTLAATRLKIGTVSGETGMGAYVISQTPVSGQQVEENSKVDLVVETPVIVPNLADANITDAVSMLQGLGLKVAFIKMPTANPFGKTKVEGQDPGANASVHRNTQVTLTVSTPPAVRGLVSVAAQEPAYKSLKPQYKNALDSFLGNPNTPRGMDAVLIPAESRGQPKR